MKFYISLEKIGENKLISSLGEVLSMLILTESWLTN